MSLDPNKTYLEWNGTTFPNSLEARFKAPAGSTIDWGDGVIERFQTGSATRNEHSYEDGKTKHTITISNLTSIGNYAFAYCSSLTSITIGNGVMSIGDDAFYYCSSLTSVVIPDGVTSIGNYAFRSCSSLTSITIPESVTSIGSSAFSGCSGLTEINYNATECADLSSSNYVFAYAGQSGMGIAVTIGANVKKIPEYLFSPYSDSSYAPKITSVVFEEGSVCESIGSYAFEYCSSLTSVTIGDSVTSIGSSAFSGCSSLTSVTIGNSVKSIGDSTFYGCKSLKSVNIPNSVKSIGPSAFHSCEGLTSITIPDSVNHIGWYLFERCYNLTSVTLSDSITRVSGYMFKDCVNLKSIIIPDSVEKIEDSAFLNCRSLKTIALLRKEPPTLTSTNAIPSTTTIYVPQAAKEVYKAADYWSTFADKNKIESNNTYLSLIRFNKKNKEYINEKVLEIAYPVGSIYFSLIDTSPARTIGGNWSRLGAYTLSSEVTSDSLTVYVWKRSS